MGSVFVKGVAVRSTSIAPARSGSGAPERSVHRPAPSPERSTPAHRADEAHLETPRPPAGIAVDAVPGREGHVVGDAEHHGLRADSVRPFPEDEVLEALARPVTPARDDRPAHGWPVPGDTRRTRESGVR